jgi:uncharacterized protein (TIGR00369 family)
MEFLRPEDHIPNLMNDDNLMAIAHYFFIERTPFNRVLGIRVKDVGEEAITIEFDMKDDLYGNTFRGLLHGGVTASILDVVGGMAAFFNLRHRMKGQPVPKVAQHFSKFGTVDLRIDYLRPGQGKSFTAKGVILRSGSRIAVARMELYNEIGKLLAVGTGTYMVG